MKKVKLPSGAELAITVAPFADSKELYQACLDELKNIKIDGGQELDYNFIKDIFCSGFASKKIEEKIWKCLSRCLYNDLKITEETFEDEKARGDYFDILFEVTQANILPFTKNLYVKFSQIRLAMGSFASSPT